MPDNPAKPPRLRHIGAVLVVAFLSLLAYLTIARMMRSRIEDNESAAPLCLWLYLSAQNMFHQHDHYEKGSPRYANPVDGKGFPELYQLGGPGSGGKALGFLHRKIAEATSPERAFKGYYFVHITHDADGAPRDYTDDHGLCAVPAAYGRSARLTWIMETDGTAWFKDNAGRPVTQWPDTKDWIPLGWDPDNSDYERYLGFPSPWASERDHR